MKRQTFRSIKANQPEARVFVVAFAIHALRPLEVLFSRAEMDVSIHSHGQSILQQLQLSSRPTVVLIDCSAPFAAEARDLARRIKDTECPSPTRILGLISQTDWMPFKANSMWGFDDAFIKPLFYDDLIPQIEENLSHLVSA